MKNNETVLALFKELRAKLDASDLVVDKSGAMLVEKLMAVMELDPSDYVIDLGAKKTNLEYVKQELDWYDSMSLSVDKIGKVASIWNAISSSKNEVNSNYGYLCYSAGNYHQFTNCAGHLLKDKTSRRAVMIYNRPTMHEDYTRDGMNDFVCTLAHQFFVRDGKLHSVVNMRSNDAIYGFFNDFAWFCAMHKRMMNYLNSLGMSVELGNLIYSANSFHVYEKHFDLLKKITDGK